MFSSKVVTSQWEYGVFLPIFLENVFNFSVPENLGVIQFWSEEILSVSVENENALHDSVCFSEL